jgi:hypothetical protein
MLQAALPFTSNVYLEVGILGLVMYAAGALRRRLQLRGLGTAGLVLATFVVLLLVSRLTFSLVMGALFVAMLFYGQMHSLPPS